MIFTDTHSHHYSSKFKDDLDDSIQRAFDNKVERIFLPNIDRDSIESMNYLVEKYPGHFFPMMGLHPCSVQEDFNQVLDDFEKELRKGHYVGVGEIGIDLYWDKSTLDWQVAAFERQILWAKELNLPIVIHARDSFDEIFEVVDRMNDESLTGIFHCFTGNTQQANKIIDYGGFKLGIGGVVTFKNSKLGEELKTVDPKHLVLETDSPYLAPAPNRGKRNESSFLPFVAGKLAEIYNMSVEEIADITTRNSKEVFGI